MVYPENPNFDPIVLRTKSPLDWKESWAENPALIEENGVFYAFSADSPATRGGQIRLSSDLIHWKYAGSPFVLEKRAYAKNKSTELFGNLYESFLWCRTFPGETNRPLLVKESGEISVQTLHCIRGKDRRFWLYYSMTGYEGGSKSCIGLAKADRVTGPYSAVGLIVCSKAGWRSPNAADPFVFEGENGLYLVYGKEGMGLYLLPLDRETGLRTDGLTRADYDEKRCSFEEYFGKNVARGSVRGASVLYQKDVPVYDEEGVEHKSSFYTLLCNCGEGQIRSAKSSSPEGPYLDFAGNEISASAVGTGELLFERHHWRKKNNDVTGIGRAALFRTSGGVGVVSYHAATHALKRPWPLSLFDRKKPLPYFLFVNRFLFDRRGNLLLHCNRFGGEQLCPITKEDFLGVSSGTYLMLRLDRDGTRAQGEKIVFTAKGQIQGAVKGFWRYENELVLTFGGETYRGPVLPFWCIEAKQAGISASLLSERGEVLYLNSLLAPEKN